MALKPVVMTTLTGTAASAVRITATSILAWKVRFESVAGTIYIGDSTVSATKYMVKLTAGVGITLDGYIQGGPNVGSLQLSAFYFDCATNGDKLQVTYFEREGNV